METFWASSKEEEEKIVDRIISNYSYESKPTNFQTRINIPEMTAGTVVSTVGIELSNENPKVFVSYGQSRETMALFSWGLAADLHDIANFTWGKEISVEAGAVFSPLTSPINVPPAYTYMTYEELLKEYRNLKSENEYFRKQLTAINTPQKLQRYSVCYGFVALFFIVIEKIFSINLVHPILAYFVFGISAFFYLIGILMEKKVGE